MTRILKINKEMKLASLASTLILTLVLVPVTAGQVSTEKTKILKEAQEYFDKGQELFDAKKYQEATEAYKRGISLDPNNTYAHGQLAYIYSELGRNLESLEIT